MKDLYQQYVRALKDTSLPSLFLDIEALEKNIQWVKQNSGQKKIRLATKSLRSVPIIKKILNSSEVFQGLMTFTLEESLWLKSQGFQDILMGYPTTDVQNLKKLIQDPEGITLMVDRPEHLEFLENIAKGQEKKFSLCVDLDLSMDLPGVRFGVYRSHIHSEKELILFLEKLKSCPHLNLVGAMGYEAQIAGVMDKNSALMKTLKGLSLPQLKKRRQKMVDIIHQHGHELKLINGGGTGSLQETIKETCVTEVTVGSAFFAPVLFDHYQHFTLTPALMFALPIVRRPSKNIYTLLGGGYIASGAIESIKQPQVYLPTGMNLLKHEGTGEVQTPVQYDGELKLGDPVILRHAKAGEVCERFNEIHLLQEDKLLETVKTYRGEGKSFL